MSTEALTEILQILRKHPNISVKVSLLPSKNGFYLTNIHLTEPTGIQSTAAEKGKKKRKSPSRLLRDSKRNEAFLAKKAGVHRVESTAAPPSQSTARCTDPTSTRRRVKPGRRLDPSGKGSEEETVSWPDSIPQLDGGEASKDEEFECEHRDKKGEEEKNTEDEKEEEEE